MFIEKYRPTKLDELLGNKSQFSEIVKFVKEWKKQDVLLVYGPIGCGKSLTIKLVADSLKTELLESHASDERSLKKFEESVKKASLQQSLIQKKKIILIENVDRMESMKAITDLIKTSNFPVILTTEDPYSKKLYSLKSKSTLLKFNRIRSDSINKFLKIIKDIENLDLEESKLNMISRTCSGDVRAALNDLESLADGSIIGSRDNEMDIFNTVKILFKTRSIENVFSALKSSEKSINDILLWLEWNIIQEYEKSEEVFLAFDYLSKADVFNSRIIKRQSWSLSKYNKDLGTIGVALAKKEMYRKFTRYTFPRPFSRQKNRKKLSYILKVSENRVKEYIPLLIAMSKKKNLPEGIEKEDI